MKISPKAKHLVWAPVVLWGVVSLHPFMGKVNNLEEIAKSALTDLSDGFVNTRNNYNRIINHKVLKRKL